MKYAWIVAACLMGAVALTSSLQAHDNAPRPPAAATEKASTGGTPGQKADALKVKEGDHVLGKADAPVTIVEYASLSCPHCAAFHQTTLEQVKQKYIETGKVRFVFRDFPFNAPALRGSMVAHCAGKEKYYTFLKVLFDQQSQWAFHRDFLNILEKIARLGGMSAADFKACMENKTLEEKLITRMKEGAEVLGVKTTPTFFINGTQVEGHRSLDEFSAHIDPLLKK